MVTRTVKRTELRVAGVGLVIAAVAALFAACGGAAPPGVASVGSMTTTAPRVSGGSSTNNADLSYVKCMRTHGIKNFPDLENGEGKASPEQLEQAGIDPNSAQFISANNDCRDLLLAGELPAATPQYLAQALKWVRCLRAHGAPDFPDPTTSSTGGVIFVLPVGIDQNSPTFQAAMAACRRLIPSGGFASRTSSSKPKARPTGATGAVGGL
jgi:hypothetical protein